VSRRESHDSSGFYARFEPPVFSDHDEVVEPKSVDEVFLGDSRDMADVADDSVALVVTSPPYFAGKAYEEALGEGHIPASYLDYLQMITDVFAECVRTLEPGGRIAVNVANLGRRPYRSLSADVVTILQDRLGLWLRGEIVWQKARGAAGSCAWGSFAKPSNPVLRDLTERVIVASKGRPDRARTEKQRQRDGLPNVPTIAADDFMEATLDVWELGAESASRVGHPAPFPVELPQRLIELHTYEGDLVLDPFMGSGSTGIAAVRTGRHYVGYDTDADYVELARSRVAAEVARVASAGLSRLPREKAVDVARRLAVDAGMLKITDKNKAVKLPGGVELAFGGVDGSGTRWVVDVVGGFTTGGSGLRRSDLLWRTLGRAATIKAADPATHMLVMTTDLPSPRSPAAKALDLAVGSTIDAVVDLGDPRASAALGELFG
jgi:site-specific DNA-methyltransferase (adenine-specific)